MVKYLDNSRQYDCILLAPLPLTEASAAGGQHQQQDQSIVNHFIFYLMEESKDRDRGGGTITVSLMER